MNANDNDCSNNTNKLSPQELFRKGGGTLNSSNNTNKLSPQERVMCFFNNNFVQIIQINLVLKNAITCMYNI